MPFIGRKSNGTVYGVWTQRQPDDPDHANLEEVEEDHPDVVAFRTRPMPSAGRKTLEERLAALEEKVK